MVRVAISLLLALFIGSAFAQERCGTVQYEKMMNQRNPKRGTKEQFENWLQQKMQPQQKAKGAQAKQQTQATYTIPIVVHVIHNGEPIGTGVNISDAQILSQLKVLNNDFNRLNEDQTNTPALFQSVAGSFDVQFVLAKQDPNGLATNGIRRVQGSKSAWSLSDNFLLKSQSYWPTEDYLNVWVCNLTGFLGYTQFPVSNLPGLEGSSDERLTDGIVVNYREFGSIDDGTFDLDSRYNKGRTLTHEMGHFFGLRHVWGDGTNCTSTDYVADTPTQSRSTTGCPTHPQQDCGSPKMFQNYLDYTNDACMNIFTQGQVSRMNTVIQSSPRRASLLVSPGSLLPSTAPNDTGIRAILNPLTFTCSGVVTPSLTIRNYGINLITSTQIQLLRNGVVVETKTFPLNLLIAQETNLTFSPLILNASSTNQFTFQILQTNGGTDGNVSNDFKSITTVVPANAPALPFTEDFNSFPGSWNVLNPDGLTAWQGTTTPDGRTSAFLNFYDYTEIGSSDVLSSPTFDLTSSSKASLIFDRAYSTYPEVIGERLRVLVISNCNFQSPFVVFSKSDNDLSTAPESTSSFAPIGKTQWVTEVIPLDAFVGQTIQVAFEGTNANGNNLYIDNVRIVDTNLLDLAFTKLESPSPVNCLSNPPTLVTIKNLGNVPITNFVSSVTVNGQASTNQTINLSLAVNEEKSISLNTLNLSTGSNSVTINLTQPNGATDQVPLNNSSSFTLVVNDARDIVPLRQRFESTATNNWVIVNQGQQANWQLTNTNFSNSLVYNGFVNTNLGDESWLVSPVIDFSQVLKATVFFTTSYAKAIKGSETLRVLASTDCGVTFSDVLDNQSGSELSNTPSDLSWKPLTATDWKKQFIILNDYVGKADVRLAFVVNNGNGNNLYLDNIDFYADDNLNPVVPEAPYSIYGGISTGVKISFNLEDRMNAKVWLYNTVGQLVSEFEYPNALNQTFPLDIAEQSAGIYIARVQVGSQFSAQRVFFTD